VVEAFGIQPARNPFTRKSSPALACGESTDAVPAGERMDPPADCSASAKLTVSPSYGASCPA
jgi:hypothetical protein